MPIRDIEPAHVIELQRGLREDGVGAPMAPVQPVRIPQSRRKRAIRPLAPETIERMRAFVLARGRVREAALLSVMGYAGLWPGEAFALTWDCLGERSPIVEHGRADGALAETKTRRIRTVGLLTPVADDLCVWREQAPRAADAELIFPRTDGAVFRDTDYRNWRKRHFSGSSRGRGGHPLRAAPQLRQPPRAGRLEPA